MESDESRAASPSPDPAAGQEDAGPPHTPAEEDVWDTNAVLARLRELDRVVDENVADNASITDEPLDAAAEPVDDAAEEQRLQSTWTRRKVASHVDRRIWEFSSYHVPLTLHDVHAIFESMPAQVVAFTFFECRLGPNELTALLEHLHQRQTVTELTLNVNEFGPAGGAILAASLDKLPHLKRLSLFRCEIGIPGTAQLCEAFKFVPGLKALNLSSNGLLEEGGLKLMGSIGQLTNLEDLDISRTAWPLRAGVPSHCAAVNGIGPKSAALLRDVLPSMTHLRRLKVFYNWFGVSGRDAICEGVRECPTLEELDIEFKSHSDQFIRLLCDRPTLAMHSLLHTTGLTIQAGKFIKSYKDGVQYAFDVEQVRQSSSRRGTLVVSGVPLQSLGPVSRTMLIIGAILTVIDLALDVSVIITTYIPEESWSYVGIACGILLWSTSFNCWSCYADGRSDVIPWQLLSLGGAREAYLLMVRKVVCVNLAEDSSKPSSGGAPAVQQAGVNEAFFESLPQWLLALYAAIQQGFSPLLTVSLFASFFTLIRVIAAGDAATWHRNDNFLEWTVKEASFTTKLKLLAPCMLYRAIDTGAQGTLLVLFMIAFQYWVFLPFGLAFLISALNVLACAEGSIDSASVVMWGIRLLVAGPGPEECTPHWAHGDDWRQLWDLMSWIRMVTFIVCCSLLWLLSPVAAVGGDFEMVLIIATVLGCANSAAWYAWAIHRRCIGKTIWAIVDDTATRSTSSAA